MTRRKPRKAKYAVVAWTPDEVPATQTRQFFTLHWAAVYVWTRYKQAHQESASQTEFAIDGETFYRLYNFTVADVRKELAV